MPKTKKKSGGTCATCENAILLFYTHKYIFITFWNAIGKAPILEKYAHRRRLFHRICFVYVCRVVIIKQAQKYIFIKRMERGNIKTSTAKQRCLLLLFLHRRSHCLVLLYKFARDAAVRRRAGVLSLAMHAECNSSSRSSGVE